jgi:hypothetical protein
MPPVAIECVRIFGGKRWLHLGKPATLQNKMSPNQIIDGFWGLLRISFVRSIQPWKQTTTGTEEFLRQNQQDPGPNSGSDDPSDSA